MTSEEGVSNDLAKSLDNNTKCNTKDKSWMGTSFKSVTLKDLDEPTKLEEIECTKHVKEKNERFTVHPDNTKNTLIDAWALQQGNANAIGE